MKQWQHINKRFKLCEWIPYEKPKSTPFKTTAQCFMLLSHVCGMYVRVHTCVQPDLSQGHPGVHGSVFGGTALQGGGYLRQGLLHAAGCYGCGMN